MDKINQYRQILQQVLESYAREMSSSNQVQILPVCDISRDQYLLISLGWSNKRREHAIVFHAQLREEKLLLEDDRTETGLSDELIQAGILEEDIRLMWAALPQHPVQKMPLAA